MGRSEVVLAVLMSTTLAAAKPAPARPGKPGKQTRTEDKALDGLSTRARSSTLTMGDRRRTSAPGPGDVDEGPASQATRLAPKVVERVVNEHRAEVKACYDQESVRAKRPSGEVTLRFVVDPTGIPSRLSAEVPGVDAGRIERCLARSWKGWRFPVAAAETEVEFPFVFVVGEK